VENTPKKRIYNTPFSVQNAPKVVDYTIKRCIIHLSYAHRAIKAVIFLDWVNSGAPWRSRLWIRVDPVNLIAWMEWI
jgi:hypothetical protein